MDRRQLEYFIAIVEHRSFTGASKALRIAQPSLSQAMKAFEAELGAKLFTRSRTGSHLTSAGDALVGPARQILRGFDSARGALSAVTGLSSGRLDIACSPGLTSDPLAELLGTFHRRYPSVAVRIVDPGLTEIATLLRTGEAEVALGYFEVVEPDLVIDRIPAEIFLVMPPGTSVERSTFHLSDLRGVDLIVSRQHLPIVVRILTEQGVMPRVFVETFDREAIIPLVLQGVGSALLLRHLASMAKALGAVTVRLDPPPLTQAVVYTPSILSPAGSAFREIVLEYGQSGEIE